MLGPFATTSRLTPIHQMSLAVLSRAACASISTTTPTTTTTTTTTTTRDRGDRYGPMEWAQLKTKCSYNVWVGATTPLMDNIIAKCRPVCCLYQVSGTWFRSRRKTVTKVSTVWLRKPIVGCRTSHRASPSSACSRWWRCWTKVNFAVVISRSWLIDWFYWTLLQPLQGWIAKYNMYTKIENTNNRKYNTKKTCTMWLCL